MLNQLGRGARRFAAGLGILGLCALGASARPNGNVLSARTSTAVRTPETVLEDWPESPRSAARAMIAKYGEPDEFGDKSLVWYKNGPWQKTVVYRKAPQSFLGYHGKDILEQSIAYNVPDKKIEELKRFDNRLEIDKAAKTLSARSDSENLNMLALNLANEIVTDKRGSDEARDFYRKTAALAESGKTSAYMTGFLFPVKSAEPGR